MNEILTPISLLTGSTITSLTSDLDCNFLYAADARGYLSMWSIDKYIEDYFDKLNGNANAESNRKSTSSLKRENTSRESLLATPDSSEISLVVCWRGHLSKICALIYSPTNKIILSASQDESVR